MRKTTRRLLTLGSVPMVVAAALGVTSAATASASSIQNDYVQLCAQGDYPSVIQFPDRGGWSSTVVNPGDCWWNYVGGSSWEPINVLKVNGDGSQSYLGTVWYDGDASGVGIGTEGSSDSPWYQTW
ncbi:hypothetical protein KGQ20_45865 [Catenulispora sp. NF23]|uniref:Secreted protein n=1 Tax=Catenulispora pinistramenti TaxID=2705254 RepID=A0ABS5L700_9ACTN|nr:hypothetical protein [Catenulispora pinistramenti]MBS2540091.1 hypothetical protein [Catenulispora pinistramenti]MBS2554094.1 hypothetical protein [Catenulispora pinistramenti]